MYEIDYVMEGSINGVDVRHVGRGHGDPENGVEELEIQLSSIPTGWDPLLMPLICSGPSRVGKSPSGNPIPTTLFLSNWNYFTEPGKLRLGELFDSHGNLVGSVEATGAYEKTGPDRMRYRVKITSQVNLPEKLDRVEYYSYLRFPDGPNKLVAYSQSVVSTVSGKRLFGVANIPYAFKTGKAAEGPVAGFQVIETQLNGLTFRYQTTTVIRYVPLQGLSKN